MGGGGGIRGLFFHRLFRFKPAENPSISFPSLLISSRSIASKLFVKGISFSTTENSLEEAFSQFGEVVEAKVIMNKAGNRPKGFAYVTFATDDQAQKAALEMNGKLLDGRVISVIDARYRLSDGKPVKRPPRERTNDS